MDRLAGQVARRYKTAVTDDLWKRAEAALHTFNERYKEAQRLREPLDEAGEKLLGEFAFRHNGTAPSFDAPFTDWLSAAFGPTDIGDPDKARPQGRMVLEVADGKRPLRDFLSALDAYRDALQAVVAATAPFRFTYQGFQVENPQHMGDAFARRILEGVDYLVGLFKKRGLEKLLNDQIRRVEIVPALEGTTLGQYFTQEKSIILSGRLVGMGTGRFMKWVNEAFLHEFGHHVHLNYLAREAKAEWDAGWVEIKEKQDALELVFKTITREERVSYYNLLKETRWNVSQAAKKLDPIQRVKFGVWLRTPMVGNPLITEKRFQLSKEGQYMAFYMTDPAGFLKKNYDLVQGDPKYDEQSRIVAKRIADKLGLTYGGAYSVPAATVEELAKADPSMQKTVDEALAKLEIVSDYGRTNEKEDFAETFVAFVGAPEKLTNVSKFRMQRALSLSGLYGKPVMRLATRFLASTVVPFKPKPGVPTLAIGGKKYVLSDYFPFLSDIVGEPTPGGAKLIDVGGPRFSYLWAYDIEKKYVYMWRISDGDEKAAGPARSFTSEILALERKGQLNRVTHDEVRTIEHYMAQQQKETLAAMKKFIEENADEWDRTTKKVTEEFFEKKFLPRILAKFREVEQGVYPLGFKVNDRIPRAPEHQAKLFVAEQIIREFTLDAVEDYARTKGLDPDNPPGDIQAFQWARQDVLDAFYERYFR